MKVKPLHSIGIIAIVLALCAGGWLLFQPKKMETVVTYRATTKQRDAHTSQTTQSSEERQEETLAEKAERTKDRHLELMRALGWKEDEPGMQKLKKILNSPAYLEYVRKQAEKPGFNAVLWWELHESLGIPHTGRRVQEELFRKYFPDGGDYADYEPLMRKRVAEIALEDPAQGTADVLRRFNADFANQVWRHGYFNGYEGEYEWGDAIRQNAASIVAEPTPWDVNTSPSATEPASTGETRTTDIPQEHADTQLPPPQEAASSPAKVERISQSDAEIEAALAEQLRTAAPELPTDAQLETVLRTQFSPQRFTRAMQTLQRYGPAEGLRRLQAADPEVAAYVKRLLPRKAAENLSE